MFLHSMSCSLKGALLSLTFFFLILQSCSENPASSPANANGDKGPLEGAWITIKIINDDYELTFENENNNYLDSRIIRFKGDKFQRYYNRDGNNYDIYSWDLEYGEDSITIISGESSTLNYHFEGETLVLEYTTPFGNAESAYYASYTGKLPPASWTE